MPLWRNAVRAAPRLVYALITGYGTDGPDKDKPAYDIAGLWARSGIAHMLTQPGAHPPFQRGGMGDHGTGMVLAGAISAVLVARARTGKGQLVSTSLLRQGLYTLSFDLATALRLGTALAVARRASMGNPCINNYQAKDGKWFWVVGLEADRHWPPLCKAAGHPEWENDPRFATPRDRAKNAEALIALLDSRWFLGEVRECVGHVSTLHWDISPLEDNGMGIFTFDKGKLAFIHSSWTEWAEYMYLEVYGSQGYIRVDNRGTKCITTLVNRMASRKSSITAMCRLNLMSWSSTIASQAINSSKQPLPNGFDGLRAVQMAYGVYESSRLGKKVKIWGKEEEKLLELLEGR